MQGLLRQLLVFFAMKTYIYIDGFNLFYRRLKGTTFKWLDLKQFSSSLLSEKHKIAKIKFFTARVSGKWDEQKPIRQQAYLEALKAYIPEIEIIEGIYRYREVYMPTVASKGKEFVKVIKAEEKGSDVNLAVDLLHDAWKQCYDCAVVVSNDHDLAESLRIVKNECKKVVGLFITDSKNTVKSLITNSNFQKHIRENILSKNQLPLIIPNTSIRCPSEWKN